MTSIQKHMDREVIRYLVSRNITCQITGRVLDVDTCAVLRDYDGDPVGVYDPSVFDNLTDVQREGLEDWGLSSHTEP